MYINRVVKKIVIKCKMFLKDSIYTRIDFRVFRNSAQNLLKLLNSFDVNNAHGLLIISGRGMNIHWAQIFSVLSLALRIKGYKGFVLTTRTQKNLNRYYKLFSLKPIFLEDYRNSTSDLPQWLDSKIQSAKTFFDYRDIVFNGAPIGQIALSTYSRYHGTGVIDVTKEEVRTFVNGWIKSLVHTMTIAEEVFHQYNIHHIFINEVFFEEYGAFYYAALRKELGITRFAGTVRDNAIIVNSLTKENDRIHHASLSPRSWNKLIQQPFTSEMDRQLMQNFLDRYGDKWHRSKRNHPNTRIVEVNEARKILGIAPGRKVAVIYSHILYDTLFFFKSDLFENYALWLIETVRVACKNDRIDWMIKVHPSNLWRGELESLLQGRYEEERLLYKEFGQLPKHVRIIPADTPINPYSWFQLADYGITVRGTSGLEMAALGKTVITAGTGRYEGNGFTLDPNSPEQYLKLLNELPNIKPLTQEQVELAKRYAHAIFIRKPFSLTSLCSRLSTGQTSVKASDDAVYYVNKVSKGEIPEDILTLAAWIEQCEYPDLLTEEDGRLV